MHKCIMQIKIKIGPKNTKIKSKVNSKVNTSNMKQVLSLLIEDSKESINKR